MNIEHFAIDDLQLTPDEAAETLSAIRAGRVDAVVINGATGHQVVTFRDADHAYRTVVEAMAEGAALVTRDGILCFHNPRFAQLTAEPGSASLVGRSLRDVMSADAAPSIDALIERGAAGPARVEVWLKFPDGNSLPVQLTASPATVGGTPMFCIIATDLGAQHLQEELYREALVGMEARDRLLSVAGHELRTPLQSLELQLEILMHRHRSSDGKPPDVTATINQLETLRRQSVQLTRLVNTLLDLGRVNSNQLELVVESVDLGEVVFEAAKDLPELTRSGSKIELEIASVRGRWDRMRLAQAATNLISNAAKYGLGKPIRVVVEGDDHIARLTVEDHGVGIPRDAIERVFRPFERIASARTTSGLGLGLYITAQIVKAHGGTIRVESDPGVASRFIVELPRTTLVTAP